MTFVPRAVFGVQLEESLDIAQIASLPAIVFRCIQYLEAKQADQEEGIYRLSGSSAVIKSLKDRFNMGRCCTAVFDVCKVTDVGIFGV
jgi:RalA-binding protein 1